MFIYQRPLIVLYLKYFLILQIYVQYLYELLRICSSYMTGVHNNASINKPNLLKIIFMDMARLATVCKLLLVLRRGNNETGDSLFEYFGYFRLL